MCKKEKCPNFDKCKCGTPKQVLEGVNTVIGIDHEIKSVDNIYENLTWMPMTTSPRNLLNTQVDEDVSIDNDIIVGKLSVYNTDTPIVFNYFLLDEEKSDD